MSEVQNPELLSALREIFASRGDLRTIVEYQQRLFATIKELSKNHQAVHEHVRSLTESHNKVQSSTDQLIAMRHGTQDALRELEASHRQTQTEIKRAMGAIEKAQKQLDAIPELERRITVIEERLETLEHRKH